MLNSLNDIQILKDQFLGAGAFSSVHLVVSNIDGRKYALKRIDLKNLDQRDIIAIKNEISIHKSIKHEYLLDFVDCLQIGTHVYLLLEFASNGSLFYFINAKHGLPRPIVLRVFRQMVEVIEYLQANNIAHRDIKPENILLDSGLNVRLSDFGSSCRLDSKVMRESICGTYEYMSPEVLGIGEYTHDQRTDIWAMGILMFELLEGSLKRQSAL